MEDTIAALALLLASIGIFGALSYAVGQRTAEIGIRMALGARPAEIASMILRQGMTTVFAGLAAGLAGAAALTRLLESQLYAVSPLDPAVYAITAALLGLAELAACFVPARRAMRLDPVEALRHE